MFLSPMVAYVPLAHFLSDADASFRASTWHFPFSELGANRGIVHRNEHTLRALLKVNRSHRIIVMTKNTLTPKQRTLVDTLVATGCSIKDAAKAAGYSQSGGGETGRVSGSKAMRLPHVRAYMRDQMHEAFGSLAPLALRRLVTLLDAESEHVQMEASKQLLDRAGYGKPKDDSKFIHQIGHGESKIIINLSYSPTHEGDKIIEADHRLEAVPLDQDKVITPLNRD
jgi:hypothetical protein